MKINVPSLKIYRSVTLYTKHFLGLGERRKPLSGAELSLSVCSPKVHLGWGQRKSFGMGACCRSQPPGPPPHPCRPSPPVVLHWVTAAFRALSCRVTGLSFLPQFLCLLLAACSRRAGQEPQRVSCFSIHGLASHHPLVALLLPS